VGAGLRGLEVADIGVLGVANSDDAASGYGLEVILTGGLDVITDDEIEGNISLHCGSLGFCRGSQKKSRPGWILEFHKVSFTCKTEERLSQPCSGSVGVFLSLLTLWVRHVRCHDRKKMIYG
jgi:hypothetical protein